MSSQDVALCGPPNLLTDTSDVVERPLLFLHPNNLVTLASTCKVLSHTVKSLLSNTLPSRKNNARVRPDNPLAPHGIKFDHPLLRFHAIAAFGFGGVTGAICELMWKRPWKEPRWQTRAKIMIDAVKLGYCWFRVPANMDRLSGKHPVWEDFFVPGRLRSVELFDVIRETFLSTTRDDFDLVGMQDFICHTTRRAAFYHPLSLIPPDHPFFTAQMGAYLSFFASAVAFVPLKVLSTVLQNNMTVPACIRLDVLQARTILTSSQKQSEEENKMLRQQMEEAKGQYKITLAEQQAEIAELKRSRLYADKRAQKILVEKDVQKLEYERELQVMHSNADTQLANLQRANKEIEEQRCQHDEERQIARLAKKKQGAERKATAQLEKEKRDNMLIGKSDGSQQIIADLQRQREQFKEEADLAKETLKSNSRSREASAERFKEEIPELKASKKKMHSDAKALQEKLEKASSKLRTERATANRAMEEVKELEKKLEALKKDKQDPDDKVSWYKNIMKTTATWQATIEELEEDNNKLRQEALVYKEDLKLKEQAHDDAVLQASVVTGRNQSFQEKSSLLEKDIWSKSQDLKRITRELDQPIGKHRVVQLRSQRGGYLENVLKKKKKEKDVPKSDIRTASDVSRSKTQAGQKKQTTASSKAKAKESTTALKTAKASSEAEAKGPAESRSAAEAKIKELDIKLNSARQGRGEAQSDERMEIARPGDGPKPQETHIKHDAPLDKPTTQIDTCAESSAKACDSQDRKYKARMANGGDLDAAVSGKILGSGVSSVRLDSGTTAAAGAGGLDGAAHDRLHEEQDRGSKKFKLASATFETDDAIKSLPSRTNGKIAFPDIGLPAIKTTLEDADKLEEGEIRKVRGAAGPDPRKEGGLRRSGANDTNIRQQGVDVRAPMPIGART
ncbi:hypothetical protein HDU96_000832 [Phlyctochytrium bullatum]|nr:hypothetical protein HDU96_000832 [Phlyctochytrium bullatum]